MKGVDMFHDRTPLKLGKLLFAAVFLIFISSITLSSAQEDGPPACALNESQLLGQQWDAVGSTGGTMTDAASASANGGVMPVGSLGAELAVHDPTILETIQEHTDPEIHVLLLIVD